MEDLLVVEILECLEDLASVRGNGLVCQVLSCAFVSQVLQSLVYVVLLAQHGCRGVLLQYSAHTQSRGKM